MRTRPYYIANHWFSLATWKSSRHWYLFISLEFEPNVQLGVDTTAKRWILSWLIWRVCLEFGKSSALNLTFKKLEQLNWDDFLNWGKRKYPDLSWAKEDVLRLVESYPYLKKILLEKGLNLHYSKLMVLRIMLENKTNQDLNTSSISFSPGFDAQNNE